MTDLNDVPVDFDVVIVGAGIGGLVAARELVADGLDIVVFEARDRVGGRLLSQAVAGSDVRLDLGATWFWPNEPHVVALIQELGIDVFAQHLDGDAMYHQPDASQRMQGNQLDVASGRFANGADSLPNAIAAALPTDVVRLNEEVTSIDATGTQLVVGTRHDSLTASHAVLAVPPALAVSNISFTPPLPEQLAGLASITPVWMGATTKVVVRYSSPFWRNDGLAGAAISHYGPLREIHDMSGPNGSPAALFGFAPSTSGAATVTEQAVIDQLVEIFGPRAAEPLGVIVHDWRNEPFTSPSNVASLTAYQTFGHERFAEPTFGGRLHWASTETSRQSPGHIEGAIVAAVRTVAAIQAKSHRAS